MFKNLFRSVSTVKQLCKSIDLKHIERLDIIIWNPSNKSILKRNVGSLLEDPFSPFGTASPQAGKRRAPTA
jgi:hypothetical protein